MDRIEMLLEHELFISSLKRIDADEEGRIYCGHGIDHLLDVARIAYIFALERRLDLSREIIYAAALLHDIGRWCQYEENIPHDEASARIAQQILTDCGFEGDQISMVSDAILKHRDHNTDTSSELALILYQADKLSRKCFACRASDSCYWPEERKNRTIVR